MSIDLRGPLTPEGLTQVLMTLKDNHYYGTFLISDGLREKCFFFTRGGLRLAESNCQSPTTVQRLMGLRLMAESPLAAYHQMMQGGQNSERNVIASVLNVDPQTVDQWERDGMSAEFLGPLFWPGAYYEFSKANPDEEAYQDDLNTRLLSIGIKQLVTETIDRAQKTREIRRTIGDDEALIAITASGRRMMEKPSHDFPMDIFLELNRHDSIRVAGLSERLPNWTNYELIAELDELIRSEWIVCKGSTQRNNDENLTRIRRLEKGLENAISPIMRRQALARSYKDINDKDTAAGHFKKAGFLMLEANRGGDAVKELRTAFDMLPEDFEAHEGLIEALWVARSKDDAVNETEQLSRRYFDLGLANRARMVLEKAVRGDQQNLDVRGMLVRAYLRLGRNDRALELGRELCENLRQVGRTDEAIHLAERFVEAGIDQNRVLIMSGEKRRRLWRNIALAACLIFGILLVPSSLSAIGRSAIDDTNSKVRELVSQGQYEQAKELLLEVREKHPWSFLDSYVNEATQKIDAYAKEYEFFRKRFAKYWNPRTNTIDWSLVLDVRDAQALIAEIRTSRQADAKDPIFKAALQTLDGSLRAHIAHGTELRSAFRSACANGRYRKAHAIAQEYLNGYDNVVLHVRRTFKARGVPFYVQTNPPGARITGIGRNKEQRSNSIVFAFIDKKTTLTIEKDGYEPVTYTIDPRTTACEIPIFELKKKTQRAPGKPNKKSSKKPSKKSDKKSAKKSSKAKRKGS